jgi:hypothetical protein
MIVGQQLISLNPGNIKIFTFKLFCQNPEAILE